MIARTESTSSPLRASTQALLIVACLTSGATLATAQATVDEAPRRTNKRVEWSAELKTAVRHSKDVAVRLGAPVAADFLRPGEDALFLRTVDPGTSFEVANVALRVDLELTELLTARTVVHVLDLPSRNPTSSDDRVLLREAWFRLGQDYGTLELAPKTSFYALIGLAPRFTKPLARPLESYGLWGTAVSRFEQTQLQLGGTLGRHIYFRAHVANRNPLFFRDPNALAGDNGTSDRVPGRNDPRFESGFPILYDTLATDVSLDNGIEVGGGIGIRLGRDGSRDGLDVLGWAFQSELEERVRLRGTFYSGDLSLLEGNGIPLAVDGNDKIEFGLTATARLQRLRFLGQFTHQELAGLERQGFETELSYRIPLNGLIAVGDQTAFNWVSLAFRFSNLDNRFAIPRGFVAPSMGWDWRKYDFGVRVGILRELDVTAEYARHDMITAGGTRHPDEFLLTVRVGLE